jgi:surface antigen
MIWRGWAAAMGTALVLSACASGAAPPPATGSLPDGLDMAERASAESALMASVSSGAPRRWDSVRPGYSGYVEPGAVTTGADGAACRDFVHTLFVDGRPRRDAGRACRAADGAWRILPRA